MTTHSNVAPVIIKRKKIIAGGGHHGGAWKVAYADFVTAMMAFFMLMWLLNATTEQQRKGIADYFSPTFAINRTSGGGDSSFVGDSVFTENRLTRQGIGASTVHPTESIGSRGATGLENDGVEQDEAMTALKDVQDHLRARSGESAVSDDVLKHIVTKVTDEGLVVEFFDRPNKPLFNDRNEPTAILTALAEILVETGQIVTNPVAIETHMAASSVVLAQRNHWKDTIDRADIARHLVVATGLDAERIARITSHGDRENRARNPMSMRNNRIEFVFLRQN
jgi:chemotaxis protein MotB